MLLNADMKDLLAMVASGENNIQVLLDGNETVDEEALWIKRYRGMLLWSATQDFDARLWQVESAINTIDELLNSSNQSNQNIKRLLVEAPDITSAQTRISQYSNELDVFLAKNHTMMKTIEKELKTQIYATLALQRQRVQFYLGEARLATAQLYDNHYLEGSK